MALLEELKKAKVKEIGGAKNPLMGDYATILEIANGNIPVGAVAQVCKCSLYRARVYFKEALYDAITNKVFAVSKRG